MQILPSRLSLTLSTEGRAGTRGSHTTSQPRLGWAPRGADKHVSGKNSSLSDGQSGLAPHLVTGIRSQPAPGKGREEAPQFTVLTVE